MQAVETENLELILDENIVQMSVNGPMTRETIESTFEWIKTVQSSADGANDNLQICVEMQSESFADLSEASQQFRRVGEVLRRAPEIDRCALITDSSWIRNSAKIEGAVIPGLDLMSFAPDETEAAKKWLRDEPSVETQPSEDPIHSELSTPTHVTADTAHSLQQDAAKANQLTNPNSETAAESSNPWDNLNIAKLNL